MTNLTLALCEYYDLSIELGKIESFWVARFYAHGDQPVGSGCNRHPGRALIEAYGDFRDWLWKAERAVETKCPTR